MGVCRGGQSLRRHGKGMVLDSFNGVFEEYLGGKSVSMVDNGFTIRPIPAVHWRGKEGGGGGRKRR